MRLYHLSTNNLDGEVLSPRVPQGVDIKEDRRTKRVCFAYTIEGCILAIQHHASYGRQFHIHTPVDYRGRIVHNASIQEKVPDAIYTGEVWLKDNVLLKRVGTIKLLNEVATIMLPDVWRCIIYNYQINDIVDDVFMKDLKLATNSEQIAELLMHPIKFA